MNPELKSQLDITKPDYTVYVPGSMDGSSGDTGNEHFLVFDGPDGSMMAVWTQSTFEGRADQRIVFVTSNDEGKTWTKPKTIAGADLKTGEGMSSWGFPMVSKSGRIYVLFNRHIGINDIFSHTTGLMGGVYSDDNGQTWSGEDLISMPRSKWDNPDKSVPSNWIVWQKPLRVSEGKYFTGLTRWVSPKVVKTPDSHWTSQPAVVEFMRFENIDDDPEIADIEIRYSAQNDEAIQVLHPDYTGIPVVQEPSLFLLPDNRIFCTLRTVARHPYFTVSADGGLTWSKPEPIRYQDDGEKLLHPLSPCPVYDTGMEGECFFLFHNHDGNFQKWGTRETHYHRRPVCISHGSFRKGARQPVWFSKPVIMMDNDGIAIGAGAGRADLAMYASVTNRKGKTVLWYPERKFFLLGKNIDHDALMSMDVAKIEA